MPSNRIAVELSGEEASILSSIRKMNAGIAESEEAWAKSRKESSQFERDARRVWERTRQPLEKYNQEVDRLKVLLDKGKISQDTYNRAVGQAKQRLDSTAQSGRKAFGAEMRENIFGVVGAIGGLAAIQQTVVSLLREEKQLREEAAQAALKSQEVFPELAQLPQNTRGLIRRAEGAFIAGVGASKEDAKNLVFQLASSGLLADLPFFEELGASRLFANQADELVKSLSQLGANFKEAAGNSEDITDRLLGASGGALANVPEIAQVAARAGAPAGQLGIGVNEILAASALLSRGAEVGQAGTQLRSLLTGLAESDEFRGRSLRDIVDTIAAEGLGPTGLQQRLGGRTEAVAGFEVLRKNLEDFDDLLQRTITADEADATQRQLQRLRDIPGFEAARIRRSAERRRLITRERDFASAENLVEAAQVEAMTGTPAGIGGLAANAMAGIRFGIRDLVMSPERQMRIFTGALRDEGTEVFLRKIRPETFEAMLEHLQRQNEITAQMAEELRQQRAEISAIRQNSDQTSRVPSVAQPQPSQ